MVWLEERVNGFGTSRHSRTAWITGWLLLAMGVVAGRAQEDVYLTGVPDYRWYGGCYGTCCGNLIGYWDRHGFPDLYTGPTAGGVAPLDDFGPREDIRALWTSRSGRDGRPADQPGHEDDYWVAFETDAEDPYLVAGRPEHAPDCLGDFTGLSQMKWRDMAGECDGNIDGYSFIYWDKSGARRENFVPGEEAGLPAVDVQSGLRAWARHCGYHADTFTQLTEWTPEIAGPGTGFTFDDLRAEILAGYPLMVHLQGWDTYHRAIGDMPRANPDIHAMLIYGFLVEGGKRFARVRTSWGTGDFEFREWNGIDWVRPQLDLRPRGVIGFRPRPQITASERVGNQVTLRWVGPDAELHDALSGESRRVHRYVVERAPVLTPDAFEAVSEPTFEREWSGSDEGAGAAFYRIRLLPPPG